jgi:DNA-binding NarL/FixJ family response regulator
LNVSQENGLLAHPAKVLIVDDHDIVREGLRCVLKKLSSVRVVGQAASGKQAVAMARRLRPDLILMDLLLPELGGLEAIRQILAQSPQTRIMVVSMCQTSEHIVRALRAGAHGYFLKRSASTELGLAVLAVLRGERYFSAEVTQSLHGISLDPVLVSPLERLSLREREVLQFTAAGMTSAELGAKLGLSRKTVETYRRRIMEKLGVPDHTALIRFAVEYASTPV